MDLFNTQFFRARAKARRKCGASVCKINRACRRGVWSYSFSSHENAFGQGEKLCKIKTYILEIMFTKFFCQHCNGHIEFDNSNDGLSVKCPHCFEITKLVAPPIELIVETAAQPKTANNFQNSFMGDDWKSDPMSEKQKAMLILYGVIFKEGLTKGEAAQLIDNAINTGAKPSVESQAKAGEVWGNYRMGKGADRNPTRFRETLVSKGHFKSHGLSGIRTGYSGVI